jgi:hypothetical protein
MKESLHLLGFPGAFRLNATVPLGQQEDHEGRCCIWLVCGIVKP